MRPVFGIRDNDGAVLRAQRLYRRAASHQILTIHRSPSVGSH